jgi:hypothetical protein
VWTQAIGDNVNTVFQVWHGLGSRNVIVAVYRNSAPYDEVECDVERTDPNTVTLRTLPYVPTAGEFIVAVASGGAQATLNIAMDQWHTVGAAGEPAFQNSWTNYAAGYTLTAFRKAPDGKVFIRGFVTGGSVAVGTPIFTLPVGYRPLTKVVLDTTSNNAQGQVQVNPDGTVVINQGVAAWLSLDGLFFDTDSVNQVASIVAQPMDSWHKVGTPGEPVFQNSWVNGGNPATAFRKYPTGRVGVRGYVTTGASSTVVFTLPIGYRPSYNLYYPIIADGVPAGTWVLVNSDGTVMVNRSSGSGAYFDIEFDTDSVNAYNTGSFPYLPVTIEPWHSVGAAGEPTFLNGWVNFGGNLSTLAFRKSPDGRVWIKGQVKSGTAGTPVFQLPVGYRPPERCDWDQNGTSQATLIDTDGTVYAQAVSGNGRVSFDDHSFDTETVRQVASSAAQPMDSVHYVGATGEPAFQNSWVSYGAQYEAASFRKFPNGKVRLSGGVKGGGVGATIFTLPAGYRPPFERVLVSSAYGGVANIVIGTSGIVIASAQTTGTAPATFTSLEGVEFDTETQSSYPSAFVQIDAPPKVTSLPVAPVDGQECYLAVDTAAAYGGPYLWHCRYNASLSGTSKWEVISGVALRVEGITVRDWNAVGVPTRATTYAALSDNLGPKIAVPAAGVYEMECKATASMEAASSLAGMYMNVVGDAGVPWNQGDTVTVPAAAGHGNTLFGRRTRAIAAGATVEVLYASSNASISARFYDRALYLRPIRIG